MKFGTNLPILHPDHSLRVARAAERLGFESIWTGEHLAVPRPRAVGTRDHYGGAAFSADWPFVDPLVLFAHLAAATHRLRFGSSVLLLPLRDLFQTARSLITLDQLAGGRFMLGCGFGWLEAEFELLGREFSTRAARLEEQVEVLRRLWRERDPEFHGRFYDFDPVAFEPKPVGAGIPVFLGSSSRAGLSRAARIADGWLGTLTKFSPELLAKIVATLREDLHRYGRDVAGFELTAMAIPEQLDERAVAAARELGVDRIILVLGAGPDPESRRVDRHLAALEIFAARPDFEPWTAAAGAAREV